MAQDADLNPPGRITQRLSQLHDLPTDNATPDIIKLHSPGIAGNSQHPPSISHTQLTSRIGDIDGKINQLQIKINKIARLQRNVLGDITDQRCKDLDTQVSEFQAFEWSVRADIDNFSGTIPLNNVTTSILQMQLLRLKRRFEDVISQHKKCRAEYQGRCREQITQQQYLMEDATGNMVYTQLPDRLEEALQNDVNRQKQIQDIEREVPEVAAICQDVGKAVSSQDIAIKGVGEGTDGVVDNMGRGNEAASRAIEHARRVRKLTFSCLLISCSIVLALALGLGLGMCFLPPSAR